VAGPSRQPDPLEPFGERRYAIKVDFHGHQRPPTASDGENDLIGARFVSAKKEKLRFCV